MTAFCSQERREGKRGRVDGTGGSALGGARAGDPLNLILHLRGEERGLLQTAFVRLKSEGRQKHLVTQIPSPPILSSFCNFPPLPPFLLRLSNREHRAPFSRDYVHVCICVCSRMHRHPLMVAKAPSRIVRRETIPLFLHPFRSSFFFHPSVSARQQINSSN